MVPFVPHFCSNDPFFGLRQLELNKEHFKSWYVKNSSRIFDESIKEIIVDNKKIKRPPKLWFNYVSASIEKNKEQTLEAGVFGVPDVFRQLHTFKDIRKNDLFCYIGPYEGFKSGGRVQFEDFRKNRKMICKEMSVFRITKDYYYDETKIWDHKINLDDKKIKNYPHRFTFDKTPIFINNNIKMYELSLTTQVFTITHLPQVASKGNNHFKVFKNTNKSNTNTFIKQLTNKERVDEIALMLSGNKITDTAKAHAKQLLN